VHSFELASGAASKEYLGNLQGKVSEEKIQEALKGIGKDLNSEYIKHAEVMASTREQLQRLEKQVAQMMAKVDGFNHSSPAGGEHHDVGALLHVLKQTKEQIQTDTTKVAAEFSKKQQEASKKPPSTASFEEVVTKLDSTVEKHGGGSSLSSFLFLAIAMGACASVYKKMRTYEKKHHL
jgi:cob(I)alamin adenosyltransferase